MCMIGTASAPECTSKRTANTSSTANTTVEKKKITAQYILCTLLKIKQMIHTKWCIFVYARVPYRATPLNQQTGKT